MQMKTRRAKNAADVLREQRENHKIIKLYRQNDFPSDRYAGSPLALRALGHELTKATGRRIRPDVLLARIIRLRKDRMLPRLGRNWLGPTFV